MQEHAPANAEALKAFEYFLCEHPNVFLSFVPVRITRGNSHTTSVLPTLCEGSGVAKPPVWVINAHSALIEHTPLTK